MKTVVSVVSVIALCFVLASCDFRASTDRRLYDALKTGDTNYLQQYLSLGGEIDRPVRLAGSRIESAPLIDIAIEYGQTGALGFLLRRGANPNRRDSAGDTPLIWAVGRSQAGVAHKSRVENVRVLTQAGADPNLKSGAQSGWTPLIWAAELGDTEMVKILLASGARIDATNDEGLAALNFAANAEVARLLIAAGADFTAQVGGETPAQSAIRRGHFDTLTLLTNLVGQTNAIGKKP
jgi:serine/threonine-protein phosphatase 6 regulatory ankyrin repeat subunit B